MDAFWQSEGSPTRLRRVVLVLERRLLRHPRIRGWRTSKNSTMRRERVERPSATLMYAGSNRRSAMRRMVTLTRCASRIPPGLHSPSGDLPGCGGIPAHGEVLAHLPVEKRASWSIEFMSCGHFGPQIPRELTGDGGDHDVAGAFALGQPSECATESELGCPGTSDGLRTAVFLPLLDLGPDGGAVLIGPS
jgi:hypothetical protein